MKAKYKNWAFGILGLIIILDGALSWLYSADQSYWSNIGRMIRAIIGLAIVWIGVEK